MTFPIPTVEEIQHRILTDDLQYYEFYQKMIEVAEEVVEECSKKTFREIREVPEQELKRIGWSFHEEICSDMLKEWENRLAHPWRLFGDKEKSDCWRICILFSTEIEMSLGYITESQYKLSKLLTERALPSDVWEHIPRLRTNGRLRSIAVNNQIFDLIAMKEVVKCNLIKWVRMTHTIKKESHLKNTADRILQFREFSQG